MNENPLDLLPEVILTAGAVAGPLLGSWLPRGRQWMVGVLAGVACLAGIVAAGVAATGRAGTAFDGQYAIDPLTSTGRVVILTAALLVLALSARPMRGHAREAEFYVLLLLGALGAVVLTGARDLLLFAAGYLLASVPAYALTGFHRDRRGTEAAMKYFLVGALLGVLMLAGITILYAAGGTTSYPALANALPEAPDGLVAAGVIAVCAGMLFKAGGVPGHFWVPDAVSGASVPVGAFLTTIPKIGGLAALYRLGAGPMSGVDSWVGPLAAFAVASMTLGNLAAFFQSEVTRLLAYSAISQVGYLLLPVAVAGRTGVDQRAMLYYLAAYAVTTIGAFAVVQAVPGARTLADYRGLARGHPALAGALVVCLLGLVGTPPAAVFLGKVEAFTAVIDGNQAWLAGLAAANTIASVFYYLRWIVPAIFRGPGRATVSASASAVAYAAAVASVVLGLAGGPVLGILTGPLG